MTPSRSATPTPAFASGETYGGERVLVLAPPGRDGTLMVQVLKNHKIPVTLCHGMDQLLPLMRSGAAALVLTTEALQDGQLARLFLPLREQPPWSDLPILLLASSIEQEGVEDMLPNLGNVTVLERPIRQSSFLSAVRTALRARRRQHQVRELLARSHQAYIDAERQQAHIELLNQRLQRAMTETHHRVKNNLQIILAMVDMQMLDNNPVVPIQEMRRLGMHIRTMVAVHDLLTRLAKDDGQARFISAKDLLEQLLPLMQQLACERHIRFELQDAWLSARQGTSLALVLNELVNNAVKYSRKEVTVAMCTEETLAVINVYDDGPGFAPAFNPTTAGHTGLELVENLIRWDLQGRIRYWNRPEGGGCVTITMPLDIGN